MKKYFLTSLFIILASNIILSQINKKDIIGDWIKVKAERVDGSRIIDRVGMDTAFLEYSFTSKEFSIQLHPFEAKEGFDYNIKNDRIYVDIFSEYKIEKLSQDTLILSSVSQKEPDHKLNRYFFIKKELLVKKHPIKLEEDIPVYNQYNTPRVHKTFTKYLRTCNADNSEPIKFKGALTFDQKEKSIKAKLEFFSKVDKMRMHTLKSCIENTFLYWDFKEVSRFSKSKIYFVAKSFGNSDYIKFIFCTDNITELDKFKSINFKKLDQSEEYYLAGVSDLEQHSIDSAILNFTQSYELDNIRIDAIYKRAEAFLKKGDKEKACEDWNFLIDLDQELARKKYRDTCK